MGCLQNSFERTVFSSLFDAPSPDTRRPVTSSMEAVAKNTRVLSALIFVQELQYFQIQQAVVN